MYNSNEHLNTLTFVVAIVFAIILLCAFKMLFV